jgi:hypothetical protein
MSDIFVGFAVKEEAAIFRRTPAAHSALAVRPPSP